MARSSVAALSRIQLLTAGCLGLVATVIAAVLPVPEVLTKFPLLRLSDRSVRTGLGFYAVCRDPQSTPIQTIIRLFQKGIAAQA